MVKRRLYMSKKEKREVQGNIKKSPESDEIVAEEIVAFKLQTALSSHFNLLLIFSRSNINPDHHVKIISSHISP